MISAEQLHDEPISRLDQASCLLHESLRFKEPGTPGFDPIVVQLAVVDAALVRRLEEARMTTTETALPQRGGPVTADFDGITDQELERELGELTISAGLSEQGSVMHTAAVNRIQAIDGEVARRAEGARPMTQTEIDALEALQEHVRALIASERINGNEKGELRRIRDRLETRMRALRRGEALRPARVGPEEEDRIERVAADAEASGPKCVCGFQAEDEWDLDEHFSAATNDVGHRQAS